MDKDLNWKAHIEKLKTKITSLTGALRRNTWCFPKHIKYTIYNTLIQPHIDYLIEIWGTAAKSHLSLIQIAQNKLIKALFQYAHLTPTKKVYSETGIMDITKTYTYKTCILIRKVINNNIHVQISFTKKHHHQKIKLRNANDLILRTPRTNYGRKCILYDGAKLYNSLPTNIKETKGINIFKTRLKQHIKKSINAKLKMT